MKWLRRSPAVALAVAICIPALAVDKHKAKFMGGTLSGIAEKTDGPIDVQGSDKLTWFADRGQGRIEVPWSTVIELEYGQKAGRRLKSAIFLSPVMLFTKARKHFVTISYKDGDGKEQGIVFEFDKDDIRQVLLILKTRTGKEIVFQDEEAKKQMGEGAKK